MSVARDAAPRACKRFPQSSALHLCRQGDSPPLALATPTLGEGQGPCEPRAKPQQRENVMKTVYMSKISNLNDQMIRDGSAAISDSDLLSVFLTSSNGKTAKERAQSILCKTSLIDLFSESQGTQLLSMGITQRQLSQLLAGMELAKRSVQQKITGRNVISSPDSLREYASLQLAGLEHEVFACIFLNNRHQVIEYCEMFRGTIDSAAVFPREVVKKCLACNAAATVLLHNHPSGVAEPSDTDIRLTRKLIDALGTVDVRVLDHLVVGKGTTTSLAERGLM